MSKIARTGRPPGSSLSSRLLRAKYWIAIEGTDGMFVSIFTENDELSLMGYCWSRRLGRRESRFVWFEERFSTIHYILRCLHPGYMAGEAARELL